MDILHCDAIVKDLLLLIPKVAQAIPLRGDLRVEIPDIVVDRRGRLGDEVLVEYGPLEEGPTRLGVERPVERDSR
jgi:hypothetical protein